MQLLHVRSAVLFALTCGGFNLHHCDAYRNKICDDGTAPSAACGFVLPHPDLISYCHDPKILALQRGCFVCVDLHFCHVPIDTAGAHATSEHGHANGYAVSRSDVVTPSMPAPVPRATTDVSLSLVVEPKRSGHVGEQGSQIFPQQAAAAVSASAASPEHRALPMQEVSNWYFSVPACLALVSVGIAIRKRLEPLRVEFERVDGDDQEEINPFCSDPRCSTQLNEADLECGEPDEYDDSFDELQHDHTAQ